MGVFDDNLTRREMISTLAKLLSSPLLLSCASIDNRRFELLPADIDASPIASTPLPKARWSGDEPDRAHQFIRFVMQSNEKPELTGETSVVVIGGGMSGLMTTYFLKDRKPILLEQASRFGGNSKGASWNGLAHTLGAAYFGLPESGSPFHDLLTDLDLIASVRTHEEVLKAEQEGQITPILDSLNSEEARRLLHFGKLMSSIREGTGDTPFPEIPSIREADDKNVQALDAFTLREFIARNIGELPPRLEQFLDLYAYSTLGAPANLVSAAAGINFLTSEWGKIAVAQGGNAGVAEALYRLLRYRLPRHHLRSGCVVTRVDDSKSPIRIQYRDEKGTLCEIQSKMVVFACPKFVVKRIYANLPEEKLSRIESLDYRPYVVGHAYLRGPAPIDTYDLFLTSSQPAQFDQASDVVLSTFPYRSADRTILSFYRPLPITSSRRSLLSLHSYEKYRAEFQNQIVGFLERNRIDSRRLEDIHLARFGHALPVPRQGFYRDETPHHLAKPIDGRIFFVHQDNWALPCIETCFSEARRWGQRIRSLLT